MIIDIQKFPVDLLYAFEMKLLCQSCMLVRGHGGLNDD